MWQLIYLIKEMIKLFKTYIDQPHELTNGNKLETENSNVILLFVIRFFYFKLLSVINVNWDHEYTIYSIFIYYTFIY